MSTGPKKVDNRGGARPGSGPKPQTLTASQVALMLKKARKRAKAAKKDIDDIILDIIYDIETITRDKLAAVKLWKEYTMAKLVEDGTADKANGPSVYLPEQDKGPPQLKVVVNE